MRYAVRRLPASNPGLLHSLGQTEGQCLKGARLSDPPEASKGWGVKEVTTSF